MPIDPSAPLIRSSDVIASDVDGELVLISIEDGKYFGLDPVGSEIWRRLEQPITANALITALQDHFDGDAQTIAQEALAFIEELASRSLVHAE